MKLSAGNRAAFLRCIDPTHPPESSLVLRYRRAVELDPAPERDRAVRRELPGCSIREGARVVELATYRGVTIHVLDETSLMATGSLKAIDGCLTAARCRADGVRRIAFESGGNTGSALTRYGRQAGFETFFFCPSENLDLLDSALFASPAAHLIGVADRGKVKEFTALFAAETGIRHVPDRSWRQTAAMFRGLFILEQLLTTQQYDWLSQTVSAAFGPLGIYRVLQGFRPELPGLPRFLGVQQEANCPMYRAWQAEQQARPPADPAGEEGGLLTRIMYDDSPQTYRTGAAFLRLLKETGGQMLTINREEFDRLIHRTPELGETPALFRAREIPITLEAGRVLEKTGLMALAGTMKAIAAGTIAAGSRVLCCLTSGVTGGNGLAVPELIVRNREELLAYAEAVRRGGKGVAG